MNKKYCVINDFKILISNINKSINKKSLIRLISVEYNFEGNEIKFLS